MSGGDSNPQNKTKKLNPAASEWVPTSQPQVAPMPVIDNHMQPMYQQPIYPVQPGYYPYNVPQYGYAAYPQQPQPGYGIQGMYNQYNHRGGVPYSVPQYAAMPQAAQPMNSPSHSQPLPNAAPSQPFIDPSANVAPKKPIITPKPSVTTEIVTPVASEIQPAVAVVENQEEKSSESSATSQVNDPEPKATPSAKETTEQTQEPSPEPISEIKPSEALIPVDEPTTVATEAIVKEEKDSKLVVTTLEEIVPSSSKSPVSTSQKRERRGESGKNRGKDVDDEGNKITRSASRTSNASDEWTRVPAAEATPVGNYTALPPLPNIAELIQNSHDVRRYDKLRLLMLYSKPTNPVKILRDLYGKIVVKDRVPRGVDVAKQIEDDEISKLQQALFENARVPVAITEESQPETPAEKAIKNVYLILNKISPTTFDKLSQEFISMDVICSDEDVMQKVIDIIVDKAQLEENFCFMYAKLCQLMSEKSLSMLPSPSKQKSETTTTEEAAPMAAEGPDYRKILLQKCRDVFSQKRSEKIQEIRQLDIPESEKEIKEITMKRRYTGHIRFIGEIYILGMISGSVVLSCIEELLQLAEEEDLVCLCKLLATVGSKFEAKVTSKGKTNTEFSKNWAQIVEMSKSHATSRIRFMMKDLVDLRSNNWQARREELKAVKLSEIRGESAPATPAKSQSAPVPAVVDEWTTVPTKGLKPKADTSSKTNGSFNASGRSAAPGTQSTWAGKTASNAPPGQTTGRQGGTGDARKLAPSGGTSGRFGGGAGFQRQGSNDSQDSAASSSRGFKGGATPGSFRGSSGGNPRNDRSKDRRSGQPTPSIERSVSESSDLGSMAAAAAPVEELNSAQIQSVKNIFEEFLVNDLYDEVILALISQNIIDGEASQPVPSLSIPVGNVSPSARDISKYNLRDVAKALLEKIIDSSNEAKRQKLNKLLVYLLGGNSDNKSFISSESLKAGVFVIIENFEDVMIDAPKAGTFLGETLANLATENLLPLSNFAPLSPTQFNRKADVLGCVFVTLSRSGMEKAQMLYKSSGIDLLKSLDEQLLHEGARPEELEGEHASYLQRYQLPFLQV